MFPLQHGGIALATSLASAVNVGMLWVILTRRIGPLLDRAFARSVGRTSLASLAMAAAIGGIGLFFPWETSGPFPDRARYLLLCVAAGAAVFFAAALLLKSPEMTTMLAALRRRFAAAKRPEGAGH
jgi:putative peptidoglycan lipid II flippase